MVIKPRFDSTYRFENGLAKVIQREEVMETIREGNRVIGVSSVTKEKIGYIDKTGNYIWTPRR